MEKGRTHLRNVIKLNLWAHIKSTHPISVSYTHLGNFLRGFADHFIDVMNERAGFNGKAVVVPPASTGKAARINAQEGLYQLCLRGKYDGAVVNDRRIISCISRGLDVFTDWEELLRTARSPALRFVISNTTEAGIVYDGSVSYTHLDVYKRQAYEGVPRYVRNGD